MKAFARIPNINFMAQRQVGLWVSLTLTLASIALVLVRGLNLGIDFTGGVLVEVAYPQTVELEEVRRDLAAGGYPNAIAQYFGGSNVVLIRLPPAENANSAQVSTRILETLHADQRQMELRRIDFVGAAVGDELTDQGSTALIIAFIGIFLYIMFRFQWKFSAGAIAALLHDAIMAMGFLRDPNSAPSKTSSAIFTRRSPTISMTTRSSDGPAISSTTACTRLSRKRTTTRGCRKPRPLSA